MNQQPFNEAANFLAKKAHEGFDEWEQLGRIRANYKHDLILLSYTREAQYAGNFTPVEAVSRGLVLSRRYDKPIARPFDKFFNYGERGMFPSRDAYMETITSKMDGSLIIGFWYGGEFKVTTRGIFDSYQADLAAELLKTKYPNMLHNLYPDSDRWTYLMELIHPSNRIVVDYGDDAQLYLLAVRNNSTGEYLNRYSSLVNFADKIDMELPVVWSFNNPSEIIAMCGKMINNEGFVVEYSDGTRWKFKSDDYLELSKIVLTERGVARLLRNNTFDDVISRMPEHMRDTAEKLALEVSFKVRGYLADISNTFRIAPKDSRKDFAVYLHANITKEMHPYLFAMFDGHDNDFIRDILLEKEF